MPTVHEPAVLRRYLRNQAWLVAGFNGLINFGYTSYLWQDLPEVRFAGPGGAGVDLTMTAVVIGFLSTLLGTPGARSKLRRLAVPPVPLRPRWLRWLPDQLVLRSLVVAVVAGVVLGTPVGGAPHDHLSCNHGDSRAARWRPRGTKPTWRPGCVRNPG